MNIDKSQEELFKKACKQIIDINKIRKISKKELVVINNKSSLIGKGGQASVYRGTLDGEDVAVKVLKNIDWKSLSHELIIISNIKHPNIPIFYGAVLDDEKIELVFEYVEGNSLETMASKFNELDKLQIIKTICSAIELLFQNNFIHRDLKMENIMIDKSGKVYLIDFGIAKVVTDMVSTKTRAIGSVYYIAPEIYTDEEYDDYDNMICTITHKVDVWAFGCIVSYLYSGFLPWTPKYANVEPVIQTCLIDKYEFPIPDNIKDERIREIIKMATVVDPEKRATISEIKAVIDKIN